MNIGIVGHEGTKFTPTTERYARMLIRGLLADPHSVLVSGHCHLGGIDIWAEEEALILGRKQTIFPPKVHSWLRGYKPRNMQIAQISDVLHNIVVAIYPLAYKGMRFPLCYHCKTPDHIKSGGCWTAKYAQSLGKSATWHVIAEQAQGTI